MCGCVKDLPAMQTLHFRRKKYVSDLKPYWNSELTAAHDSMSLVRREWCRQGRPRDATDQAFSAYKTAKREFRRLHRKCVNIYLSNLNNEIDRMAEVDSHKFWKMVNARRNRNRSSLSSGINFDGTTVRDRDSISDGWYHYFRELYQPSPITILMMFIAVILGKSTSHRNSILL